VAQYPRADQLPDQIELEPGQYYVTAHSNNEKPADFDNPYYYGESVLFTIISGSQQNVNVNCELANTIVTIVYSDQVKANYIDYSTTVSTSAGSLVFAKDETRAGYFRTLPMTISALLTWQKGDGTTANKTLSGTIPDPQPKRKYEIHIDASSADGSAFLQINLDSLPGSTQIVNINENENPIPGSIPEGGLIISEIMANPLALDDTEGEWFEIYNTLNQPVDLFHLVIRKNTTEQHIVNAHVEIGPHAFLSLARTAGALGSPEYIYGTSLSLNNTGAILSLYNYGTDGTDGSLICAIDYSGNLFPEPNGASLSLSPLLLNYTAALSGDSWCASVTAYSTGDRGTPGTANDVCQ
jgi:hypothetical protein